MKLIATAAVTAMLLMGQSNSSAPRSVTAVRHWSLHDVTRVAVEISGPFEYRTDRLHNPDRVYFDILNAHLRIPPKLYYTERVEDALLEKIRVAETNPGTTRVVLDLTGDATATTSTLTNPDRLIIELRMPARNPLRTEVPPTSAAARPVPPPAPVLLPPPPTATVKPAPTRVATPDLKVPGLTASDAPKPPAPPDRSPAVPAPAPATSAPPTAIAAPAAPLVADEFHAAPGDPGPAELPKAAHHTSDGTNSLIRALGLKINRVVIDPGHGGHDQGTEGPKGLLEKDLVLDVALRVGRLVQDGLGAEVIYTRTDDTFIPLEGRTALANEKKADLFLSIHANSSPRSDGGCRAARDLDALADVMGSFGNRNSRNHD
ncbi:MAG: N-acetylmuramoyl-L-alanine amidase [Ignavibacteriota bacterium]